MSTSASSQNSSTLRDNALAIWHAGVHAVDSSQLVESQVVATKTFIEISRARFSIENCGKVVVVGGGKAGAGMVAGIEKAFENSPWDEKLTGWVNVPEDCLQKTRRIKLFGARPAGKNEPTEEGIFGTSKILDIVRKLDENDLCIALICGGGSALLPAPKKGISLEQKLYITQRMMNSGATIQELNSVRTQLSDIKGGKLLQACNAKQLVSLIISDVVGDPIDLIASGPTVLPTVLPQSQIETKTESLAASALKRALEILTKYVSLDDRRKDSIVASVFKQLETELTAQSSLQASVQSAEVEKTTVHNFVIGSNQTALRAASRKAESLGYEVRSLGSQIEGEARDWGKKYATMAMQEQSQMASTSKPICILGGGETIVHLAETDKPRKGGRNQELALAATVELRKHNTEKQNTESQSGQGVVILSGGTDGEDGPTDAAGGLCDARVLQMAKEKHLDPKEFLAINNSYPFLEQTDGLIKTGPTHTNVMDLHVTLIEN